MEQNVSQQAQGGYQPVGVPAETPHRPGMAQGVGGIVCGVISLLFFPIIFGPVGIYLGVQSLRKGEQALGITAIVLSGVLMVLGMIFGAYVATHPELFNPEGSMSGGVINAILE